MPRPQCLSRCTCLHVQTSTRLEGHKAKLLSQLIYSISPTETQVVSCSEPKETDSRDVFATEGNREALSWGGRVGSPKAPRAHAVRNKWRCEWCFDVCWCTLLTHR